MAKKEKKTPEERLQEALVPCTEWPYTIPKNWCWVYLIDGAAECLDAYRKPINATERGERQGNIPYYGATGQVGWIDDYLTNEHLVLLGEDGAPFLEPLKKKAYLIEGKSWVNNHAHILRSWWGKVGNTYLANYLNVFNYAGYVNGTTRLKLTQASMKKMPVPLAPLQEQLRIVDRIESLFSKLDEAKEKAQAALDSFEPRRASVLHQAFTGELTKGWREENNQKREEWEKTVIKEICQDIKVGIVIKPSQYYTDEGKGIPAFRSANVREFHIDDCDWVYLNEEGQTQNARSIVHTGDVLIVRSGYPGTACVVTEKFDGYNAIDIIIAVPNQERVNSNFLAGFTNSPIGKGLVAQNKRGNAQAHFNIGSYSKLPIELPSLGEQKEIVRIIENLLEKEQKAKEAAEQVLEQIELIKKAILSKAFRGELGTNDPEEESAEKMLKRMMEA